jgi:ComF family protein
MKYNRTRDVIVEKLVAQKIDEYYKNKGIKFERIVDKKMQYAGVDLILYGKNDKKFNIDEKAICTKCLKEKPYYDKALSCFIYNKTISRAIFEFKFYQKTFLSKFFAKFIVITIKEIISDVDYIAPVPMNIRRLRWRGFNQSLLLVKSVAKLTNKQIISDLIIKTKHTKAQAKLNNKERKINLNSVFKINEKYLELIKNKNILIIDDVITTGTTINKCSKVLKEVGVNKIYITSIAKTSLLRKN